MSRARGALANVGEFPTRLFYRLSRGTFMRNQENELYQRAVRFLYRRTNYETFKSIPYAEMENSLRRLRDFLEFLGNPERRFVLIHVAGTKGKGTVCHFIDRIYRAAGYRVGLFTSPHLDELTERFQIDGKNCDKAFFGETMRALIERWNDFCAQRKKDAIEKGDFPETETPKLTFFEWSLILAVALFARAGVDVAILEVGMGGRFDATNACDADVSVLTSVSYDHCEQLGNALLQIASEKLGIVKTNAPLVSGIGFSRYLRHEPLASAPEWERNDAPKSGKSRRSGTSVEQAPEGIASCEEKGATGEEQAGVGEQNDEKRADKRRHETDVKRQAQAILTIDPQTQISEEDVANLKEAAKARAKEWNAPFYQIDALSNFTANLPTPPFDSVRRWNFEIALKVVEILAKRTEYPRGRQNATGRTGKLNLRVSAESIARAASNCSLPARCEIVSTRPTIVVDGAHNRASVAALMKALVERYRGRKIKVLFASTIGKDVRGMIAEITPFADEIVLTERSKDERSAPIAELIQTVEEMLDETCAEDSPIRKKFRVAPDFHAFLADYCTRPNPGNEILCALGSFYFAAEVRKEARAR